MNSTSTRPNAIWFSRHAPSSEQLQEIQEIAPNSKLFMLTDEASRNLNSDEEVAEVYKLVMDKAHADQVSHVFGVFPAPLHAMFFKNQMTRLHWSGDFQTPVNMWAAWNIQRTVEGGKPTFQHQKFVLVGAFEV